MKALHTLILGGGLRSLTARRDMIDPNDGTAIGMMLNTLPMNKWQALLAATISENSIGSVHPTTF